ncbi:unnamed protein product [Rhizophagus irregularis]|nr:unnamed protein product [Rhizophagus irregularis]CAB4431439.1 unnamed protein product [Rhizophagus irregularis]
MSRKRKAMSVDTRCKEYRDIFRVDDNILFCNYCNVSVDWKHKSVIDSHCGSQKHISNVKKQDDAQNKTQQLTLSSAQAAADSKKRLIEDLIEAFAIADIPLEKVNSLLPFLKKYVKNGDSAAYMKKCYRDVLSPLMPQLIHVPCCAHILNLIGDTWRTLPQFRILKDFLDKVKEVFVNSPARRGRYLSHLKMYGIPSPCKIPLYNKTRWNSWFRMASYSGSY